MLAIGRPIGGASLASARHSSAVAPDAGFGGTVEVDEAPAGVGPAVGQLGGDGLAADEHVRGRGAVGFEQGEDRRGGVREGDLLVADQVGERVGGCRVSRGVGTSVAPASRPVMTSKIRGVEGRVGLSAVTRSAGSMW